MRKSLAILVCATGLVACGGDDGAAKLKADTVGGLATYSTMEAREVLVVFEAGLGDDHAVWTGLAGKLTSKADVLLYDRAGYGESAAVSGVRDIEHLSEDLATVVGNYANQRKVVLVGHSLGGMIVRDYAIKNPSQAAGMVFVDSSHESYNQPTQAIEDAIVDSFRGNEGGQAEARQLIEDSAYMATLSALPDVPVTAIDSMKVDASHDQADRQRWFDAKEELGEGVSNFTHLTTTKSGHYIMRDEPQLVADAIGDILSQL